MKVKTSNLIFPVHSDENKLTRINEYKKIYLYMRGY